MQKEVLGERRIARMSGAAAAAAAAAASEKEESEIVGRDKPRKLDD